MSPEIDYEKYSNSRVGTAGVLYSDNTTPTSRLGGVLQNERVGAIYHRMLEEVRLNINVYRQ